MYILETSLILGLVYCFISLGLYISFRILKIADLTTDGSFVLGMAVSVVFAKANQPVLGILCGCLAGSLAGLVTGLLSTKAKIQPILSGIITSTGLYSINLLILDKKPNLSLLKQETVFTSFAKRVNLPVTSAELILLLAICLIVIVILSSFFQTRLGLSIRATGDNETMVKSSSINADFMLILGFMIANSLTALSGSLVGQLQRCADMNSGVGIVVVGLASLVIGETLVKKDQVSFGLLACILGNIVYRLLYAVILKTRIFPIELLKLVTSIIVALAIGAPGIKQQIHFKRKVKEAYIHA